jgi:hypothetical protein
VLLNENDVETVVLLSDKKVDGYLKISVDDSGNVIISPINTLSNHSTPSTIGS